MDSSQTGFGMGFALAFIFFLIVFALAALASVQNPPTEKDASPNPSASTGWLAERRSTGELVRRSEKRDKLSRDSEDRVVPETVSQQEAANVLNSMGVTGADGGDGIKTLARLLSLGRSNGEWTPVKRDDQNSIFTSDEIRALSDQIDDDAARVAARLMIRG